MKTSTKAIAVLAAMVASPAWAGPLEDQVELLKKELLQLQQEMAAMRVVLARDSMGNVTFKAAGDRSDQVGGDFSATIGKSGVTRIGGFRSTEIATDDVLKVTGNYAATVGGSASTSVSGNVSHRATGSINIAAARSIVLEAGDQLMLKVGSASMLMQKNGDITITGTTISIKGSADVVIKGAKVVTN